MSEHRCKRLTLSIHFLCLLFFLTATVSAVPAARAQERGTVNRVAGADRYATAIDVAHLAAGLRPPAAAILARGDEAGHFADGLAAGLLSGGMEAPVLLTNPHQLSPGVLRAIAQLHVDTVYILGGEGAVSAAIESLVKAAGYKVERIYGRDRYATALEIARRVGAARSLDKRAYIVSGVSPADALIAGPAAARYRRPILQVRADSIPASTHQALQELGIEEAVIVGDAQTVGSGVEAELQQLLGSDKVRRISGADRTQRSIAFASSEMPDYGGMLIVGAENIVDGLSGGYVGGLLTAPVIYTDRERITSDLYNYLKGGFPQQMHLLGGPGAITDYVMTELEALAAQIPVKPVTGPPLPSSPPPPIGDFDPGLRPRPAYPFAYYLVKNGDLYGRDWWHDDVYLTPAPSFLEASRYYIIDRDFNFYIWRPDSDDRYYVGQYNFQRQIPYMTFNLNQPADLTASQLNNLIAELTPTRPHSPFRSMGQAFLDAQETWGVNAVYLVAHAALESAWGTSKIACDKNNIFGFMAYDDSPYKSAACFSSMEQCLLYVTGYIKADYLSDQGKFFHGSDLAGMNTRYASDPMWAVKIARIMNNLYPYNPDEYPPQPPSGDEAVVWLGSAWLDNRNLTLRLRSEPNTEAAILDQLPLGTQLTVIGEREDARGDLWFNVQTGEQTGWVHSDYVLFK